MSERRALRCYAQAKFYINCVLRHETKNSKDDLLLLHTCCLTPELSRNNRAERGRDACNSGDHNIIIADNSFPFTCVCKPDCKRHDRVRHGCCRLRRVVRRLYQVIQMMAKDGKATNHLHNLQKFQSYLHLKPKLLCDQVARENPD